MSNEQSNVSNAEERLDEAFAAYIQAKESGHPPDTEAFLAQYPALAEDVAADDRFEGLTAPIRGMASTGPYMLAEPPNVPPGTVIGNYEVLEEIGRHGQGVVYKARHVKFHEQIVALKMPLSGCRATGKEVERFVAEVENQAKLDHRNIVHIKGGGEHEGRLYFTMKLIGNGSLTENTTGKSMPSRETAELMAKIARAVHHAHQRRILHRDLKPSNILLDADGQPYVADFGLSKPLESEEPISAGYIVGAPGYMPPEQIRGEATTLSDVYGLGAIFYWLLTDQPPFQGDTREETIRQVIQEAPERPLAVNEYVDRDLEAICLECLSKDPNERYRSAEGLAKDLDRWLAGKETSARKWSPAYRLWRWCRRNPLVAGLTAMVGVLLLGVAVASTVAYVRTSIARHQAEAFRHAFEEIIDYNRQKQKVEDVAGDPDFIGLLVDTLANRELTELRDKLNETGLAPEYREELRREFQGHPGRTRLQRWMESRKEQDDGLSAGRQTVPIFSWFVTDPEGLQLARGPEAAATGMNFAFRTYFHNGLYKREEGFRAGPRDRLRATRMSAVLYTKKTNRWVIAVSTPVKKEGRFLGVVGLMVEIGPMQESSDSLSIP
jgi:hypothetical protein